MKIIHSSHLPKLGRKLTDIHVNDGLPDVEAIQVELLYYCDVLLGRETPDSPEHGYLDLQEVATAYFARASELEILIHKMEQDGEIPRGHPLNKMRTGQLRTFLEMSKRMADLGSRRLSNEQLLHDQRHDAQQ